MPNEPCFGIGHNLSLICQMTSEDIKHQLIITSAEAWFNIALRPRKLEGSLGRTAQDGHLDSHTAPELWMCACLWWGLCTALAWLVLHETAAVSVYTIKPCTMSLHAKPHVHACLAVTCHLHFRQNDGDLLRAAAVTRGWNGYRNKSQHRRVTLEKKIFPPLLQGFEPATFQPRVRRSYH